MFDANPLRVLIKALVIFAALNLVFAELNPPVGRLSVYNWLVKGRQRFPVQRPGGAGNLSVDDLDALFASHIISNGHKASREYRVIVLGDSQTWGWDSTPPQTLVGQLNRAKRFACGVQLNSYNLGQPVTSVLRDFVVLHKALEYKPDLVIWMVTTNSFVLSTGPIGWSPFMFSTDPKGVSRLLDQYGLDRYSNLTGPAPTFWERTLIGQRIRLSKLAQLQLRGLPWDATGIDNAIGPRFFDKNLQADQDYSGIAAPRLPVLGMTFDVLKAAHTMLGDTPVLIVNEPIYIGLGKYSNIRYNNTYPRWAYDQYRQLLPRYVSELGWQYLDLYDAVPTAEFADQALHLKTKGERTLAKSLLPAISGIACP
jgi:hypothetical protein